jgi:ABC-2 type transport system ATP-binding protein
LKHFPQIFVSFAVNFLLIVAANPVIEIRNIRKYFKGVKAVDGIDLSIGEAEFLALLGPNGAGKTTLVEMIEGLQRPDSGEILIMNRHWKGNENYLRGFLGISLQETRFIDKLTTTETLRLFASFYGIGEKRISEILELIRLQDKRKAYTVNLSGGQRQRLALGIALMNSPSVLLLDEPTSGLDPNSRREIWDILLALRKNQHTTMILTTHYMEEASFLCDKIVIMDKGKILAEGTLEELLTKNQSDEIIEFNLDGNPADLYLNNNNWLKKMNWDPDHKKVTLYVTEIIQALPHVLEKADSARYKIMGLECRKTTLDDLFISLTGRRLTD